MGWILLFAVIAILVVMGRHLYLEERPNCPRGGQHQVVTPAGDRSPNCVKCDRHVR